MSQTLLTPHLSLMIWNHVNVSHEPSGIYGLNCWSPRLPGSLHMYLSFSGGVPLVPDPRSELLPAPLLPPATTQITDCWRSGQNHCRPVVGFRPVQAFDICAGIKEEEEMVKAEIRLSGMGRK